MKVAIEKKVTAEKKQVKTGQNVRIDSAAPPSLATSRQDPHHSLFSLPSQVCDDSCGVDSNLKISPTGYPFLIPSFGPTEAGMKLHFHLEIVSGTGTLLALCCSTANKHWLSLICDSLHVMVSSEPE